MSNLKLALHQLWKAPCIRYTRGDCAGVRYECHSHIAGPDGSALIDCLRECITRLPESTDSIGTKAIWLEFSMGMGLIAWRVGGFRLMG
jgi:hypothetical protein